MRICLINPPRIQPKLWGNLGILQPMDIAYVAALLEKQHQVQIIDAANEGWKNFEQIDETKCKQGLTNKEIETRIKQLSPDIVGITVSFSGWWNTAYQVASTVKNVDKDVITVLSGLHPSARPVECLESQFIDFVVVGEPEYTTQELVQTLDQGKTEDFKKIKGISYRREGKTIITEPRPPIADLDALPFPARHLLPMDVYFAAAKEVPPRGEISKRWTTVMTSRGCPYNCVFCSIHTVMSRKWRARSPENVIGELEQVVESYQVKQLDFVDENMTLDRGRFEAICDLMVERGLHVEWFAPNGVRADTLDESLLRKMKASGCKKIRVAPESGVQRVVDNIVKKNLDLRAVEKAVILSKKVGIKVGCFFVVGLIGETKEDIEQTIIFAHKLKRLGADSFYFSYATPVYGTELYEQAKQGGFLRDCFSDDALAEAKPLIETPELSADELVKLCARANLVNPTFTYDRIIRAVRDPKKAAKGLLRGIAKKKLLLKYAKQ
jgi:anaerobic magnesium-protoporphyrin IX monomethyl ester cyclase